MGFFLECGSYAFCSHAGKFFTGKRGKLSVTQTCSTWQTTEESRAQMQLSEETSLFSILFSNISVNFISIFFFHNSYIYVALKITFIIIHFLCYDQH